MSEENVEVLRALRQMPGNVRLVVAIAAERERVADPVVGRVAVDVMDLERDV